MTVSISSALQSVALVALAGSLAACAGTHSSTTDDWLVLGGMHETIAQQQHEGRVTLEELRGKAHFYGVGALAGLRGELTLIDSQTVATTVGADGAARPAAEDGSATMIVGQSVASWSPLHSGEAVAPDELDAGVKARAGQLGVDVSQPFVFLVEADFTDVRLHVLNGACPIHARMRDMEIEEVKRPFEWSAETLRGTLVGIYAEEAVGTLTHPATSVHGHLVYDDPVSGERVTAHLEQFGVAPGAVFKFPAGDA